VCRPTNVLVLRSLVAFVLLSSPWGLSMDVAGSILGLVKKRWCRGPLFRPHFPDDSVGPPQTRRT
jgi:hypothetical protein